MNDDLTPNGGADAEISSQPGNAAVASQGLPGRQLSMLKSGGQTGISKERAI